MLLYFHYENKYFRDISFNQVISDELTKLFKYNPLDDASRIDIFTKVL